MVRGKGTSKFCSRSCSATMNNRLWPKRMRLLGPVKKCKACDSTFESVSADYCSRRCYLDQRFSSFVIRWKAGDESGRSGYAVSEYIFSYLHKLQCGCCALCKVSEWLGQSLKLQLDHIDGRHQNCSPENVRLLCPNCHAQQPTSGSRNNGKGRPERLKYSKETHRLVRLAEKLAKI